MSLLVFVNAMAWSGCDKREFEPRARQRPQISPKSSSTGAKAYLAKLRKHKLSLDVRRQPAQRIAFGRDVVAQLGNAQLRIWKIKTGELVASHVVDEPRRLLALSRDAWIVAAKDRLWWIPPRSKAPVSASRIPVFPGTRLVRDRLKKNRFWVLHPFDTALYGYAFEPEPFKLSILDVEELPGFDGRAFDGLADGSFVYSTKDGLGRHFIGGRSRKLKLPGHSPWRFNAGRGIGEVWVARERGRIDLLRMSGGLARSIRHLSREGIYDFAAGGDTLAVLSVVRRGKERSFEISISTGGEALSTLARVPLVRPSGSGEGWVNAVTRERALAVSGDGKWVGVGGAAELRVWNVATKKEQQLKPASGQPGSR